MEKQSINGGTCRRCGEKNTRIAGDGKLHHDTCAAVIFLRESNAIEGVYDQRSLDDAIKAWDYLIGEDVLTLEVIKHTHGILMINQKLALNEIGQFRTRDVWIGGRKGKRPEIIGPLMWSWAFEGMRKSPPIDPIALHVKYEEIHPFVDGNGRTGRMFLNWQRVKRLKQDVLVIKESERGEYYRWFRE